MALPIPGTHVAQLRAERRRARLPRPFQRTLARRIVLAQLRRGA